jgi:phosphoglycolate phosphatase
VNGAQELLERLRESGIKIGIVTRNCRRAVDCSIERTGLFFDVLLTRDDVPCVKPHPDHVLRALESLDISPANAVTVGDHTLDVRCGKAAGTKTVGFLRKRRPDDFFDAESPDLVIRDLRELLLHLPAL